MIMRAVTERLGDLAESPPHLATCSLSLPIHVDIAGACQASAYIRRRERPPPYPLFQGCFATCSAPPPTSLSLSRSNVQRGFLCPMVRWSKHRHDRKSHDSAIFTFMALRVFPLRLPFIFIAGRRSIIEMRTSG